MEISKQHLQALYNAYCKTQLLWNADTVLNIKQFKIPADPSSTFKRKLKRNLRLGQLAEQFVFNQIEASVDMELLAENIQVKKGKDTLGELDALVISEGKPIHLEIIYKFYLYDADTGTTEIEQWIGPNRKDSLIEKLTKLSEKQLPLLHSVECKTMLEALHMEHIHFEQQVVFMAQLFVPYQQEVAYDNLNANCASGFYIRKAQFGRFKHCEFYIPTKLDWFLAPENDVIWLSYDTFLSKADAFLNDKRSPLFWMKNETNDLSKGFLVWW